MIGINLLNTSCCCSIDGIRIHRLINVVIGTLAVVFNRCQLGGLFGRCQRRISLNGSGHLLRFGIDVPLLGCLLFACWCTWDVIGVNLLNSSLRCCVNRISIRGSLNIVIRRFSVSFNRC